MLFGAARWGGNGWGCFGWRRPWLGAYGREKPRGDRRRRWLGLAGLLHVGAQGGAFGRVLAQHLWDRTTTSARLSHHLSAAGRPMVGRAGSMKWCTPGPGLGTHKCGLTRQVALRGGLARPAGAGYPLKIASMAPHGSVHNRRDASCVVSGTPRLLATRVRCPARALSAAPWRAAGHEL